MSNGSKIYWWRDGLSGKQKDLRDLLWDIAQKLGQLKPLGYFPWKNECNYRPFSNAFRKGSSSKRKAIFTSSVCEHILDLVRSYDKVYPDNNIGMEVVNIIKGSKFNISEPEEFKKYYCEKTPSQCAQEEYRNCDNDCFAHWLVKVLLYIEANYWKILNDATYVLPNYESEEDKILVASIYKAIDAYEAGFIDCADVLENTVTLFNTCIQCWNIKDVTDEKLAYIKWYTARLSTWPFFRACLQELEHYDERVVYQLLKSASNILLNIEPANNELWSNIEVDLITSYISLASAAPFQLPNITHYHATKDMITSKMSRQELNLQIKLLPSLWMLIRLTEDDGCDKIEQSLNEFDENIVKANWLLYAEYNLYRYMCDPEFLKQTERFLVGLRDTEEYRKGQNDTVQSLMYLYSNYHKDDYRIKSCNRYASIVNTCGKPEVRYSYCSPSLYKRPLYDSTILRHFCNDKNKYLNR